MPEISEQRSISIFLKIKCMASVYRNNRIALNNGFKKAKNIMRGHIYDILMSASHAYLKNMLEGKDYDGFTGNTQTSYTCGLYVDGRLTDAIVSGSAINGPIRLKVEKGKTVFLEHPYEGKPRRVTGKVDVDRLYGKDSALEFLRSYKDVPRKGLAIVATTGTEYSEYLENARKLNVLTETWQKAGGVLGHHIKPL